MDAWMPERIATYKVRGFIDDAGGEVLESVPGRIRVRLGGKGCVYSAPKNTGSLSWLGFNRQRTTFDMELRFQRSDSQRENQLRIMVVLHAPTCGPTSWPTAASSPSRERSADAPYRCDDNPATRFRKMDSAVIALRQRHPGR
jgi:hypothetical protein